LLILDQSNLEAKAQNCKLPNVYPSLPQKKDKLASVQYSSYLMRYCISTLVYDASQRILFFNRKNLTLGRRYKELSPTTLKSTTMPEKPILVEGGWLETTKDEVSWPEMAWNSVDKNPTR